MPKRKHAAEPSAKPTRYFCICYRLNSGHGDITLDVPNGRFPARKCIEKHLKAKHVSEEFAIKSIFEFASRDDMDDWESDSASISE